MLDKVPADQIRQDNGGGLGKELYVIRSNPSQGMDLVKQHLEQHLAYLKELETQGILFAAGPIFIEQGTSFAGHGMVILNTTSFAEAEKIARRDPLHHSGAREYSIEAWMLNEGAINLSLTFHPQNIAIH